MNNSSRPADSNDFDDQEQCIGIDLGTTHSLVSAFIDGQPKLIPNVHGSVLTPSVVGVLPSGEIVVGQTAKELRVTDPTACTWCFKRNMGQDRRSKIGDKEFTPQELSSLVLRSLRHDASVALGRNVTDAVITVPAYFNDHARQATRLAGEMAGLNVRRMINEPTAAALMYGFHERNEEKNIVVIDLGGGTFDVTVMEVFEGTLEIRASAGESLLGGEDFTDRIVSEILNTENVRLELAELNDPLRVARLRSECETAKRDLADAEETAVRVPDADGRFGDKPKKFRISRKVFSRICNPLLQRIQGPIARAMRDANIAPRDIDEIILVGGATRMVMLREFIEDYFGKPPVMRHSPDEVVALGAAVQAALLENDSAIEDMVMTDVCPFTMGVEVVKELGGQLREGYYAPVLHRNSTIPISKEEIFNTVVANQPSVTVKIYQGDARKVADNVLLGSLEVAPLPPGPANSPFYIRFTYDVSGVLEVEAYTPGGKKFRTTLTSHVKGLSSASAAAAKRRIRELKFYPREDLANQQLARYAERMLGELHPTQREQLDRAIDAFEAAMNRADRNEFTAARQQLMMCLSSLGLDPDGERA